MQPLLTELLDLPGIEVEDYRVYLAERDNDIVVLLCGSDKSSQSKDIQQAKAYWQEYLNHEQL
jgi:putative addiction module killer protein